MSGLAFNLNGDPFELPAAAVGFRVKKLKSKGAPELVYGSDGLPLTVPLEADIEDLRRELRAAEGRYRLDPVDETGRAIASCPAAYVVIHPAERAELPPPPPTHGPADAGVEAMRMNSEIAKCVIERFPLMIESVAGLIRAADGAGLSARAPHGLWTAHDEAEQEAEPEDAPAVEPRSWPALLDTALQRVMPFLEFALAQSKRAQSAPNGDHRAEAAAREPTTSAGRAVPAPGPSGPAPASAVRSRTAASARAVGRSSGGAPSSAAVVPESFAPVAPTGVAEAASGGSEPQRTRSGTSVPPNLPTLDPAAMTRLLAVRAGLTLEEQMLAQKLISTRFSAEELRAFVNELQAMTVPEAIAEVRAVLGLESSAQPQFPAQSADDGGAS